ncbi:MAG: hypothetical protein AAB317_02405 [Nitrospirota bacterium]
MKFTTLWENDLPGEIDLHWDLLSEQPVAISRRRGLNVGKEPQKPMEDKDGGTHIPVVGFDGNMGLE